MLNFFIFKVWDLFYQADRVRTMLMRKIQEDSLRTYLFTHSSVYDSLSMATLSQMFELEQATVHSIISKMVMNEELMVRLFFLFFLLFNIKSWLLKNNFRLLWMNLRKASWCTVLNHPVCSPCRCSWPINWPTWWTTMNVFSRSVKVSLQLNLIFH